MSRFNQFNQSGFRNNNNQNRPPGQSRQYAPPYVPPLHPPPYANFTRPTTPLVPGGFTPATNLAHTASLRQSDVSSNTQPSQYPPPSPAELEKEQHKIYKLVVEKLQQKPGHISLPPNEKLPFWHNRCVNCLDDDHIFSFCPLPHVCLHRNRPGHVYKQCQALFFTDPSRDQLVPLANTNPQAFPSNRLNSAQIHFKKDAAIESDLQRYTRCVVLDARLVSSHSRDSIYQILNKSRKWESKIQVAYWRDQKYVISLPSQVHPITFSKSPPKELSDKGYIFYPWSYKEGAFYAPYRFRVWLDVYNLPSFIWKPIELKTVIGSFGQLEAHSPLAFLSSIEKVRIVVLVEDLNEVPEFLKIYSNSIATEAIIKYVGWIEEPFDYPLEPDYVPIQQVFDELRLRKQALESQQNRAWQAKGTSPVEGNDSMVINKAMLKQMIQSKDAAQELKKLLSTINGEESSGSSAREKGKDPIATIGSSSKGTNEQMINVEDFPIEGGDINMGGPIEPVNDEA